MQHPFSLLVQCITAASGKLCGQFHQQVFRIALLHVSRDRAEEHAVAAKIIHFKAGTLQQREIVEQCRLLLSRKLYHDRFQQQLTGDIAIIGGQLFKQLALVGSMLINNADLIPTLCEDISFKEFSYIPQRLRAVLYVKSHLLRCAWQAARKAAGNRLLRFCGRCRIPSRHMVLTGSLFISLRLHIQLCFVSGRTECRRLQGLPLGLRQLFCIRFLC